jgi:predicted HTH domain antitoxin
MKKERTVASRLPEQMVRDLELVEAVEQTDRATAVRKLLARSLEEWKLDYYARRYGEGELTLGRAAEEAGVSLWRMMDHLRRRKITTQYDLEDLDRDLATVRDRGSSQ